MKCENRQCPANDAGNCASNNVTSECEDFIPLDEQKAVESSALAPCSVCVWSADEGISTSSCGNDFLFIDGDAKENGFKFCPYCGKEIEIKND